MAVDGFCDFSHARVPCLRYPFGPGWAEEEDVDRKVRVGGPPSFSVLFLCSPPYGPVSHCHVPSAHTPSPHRGPTCPPSVTSVDVPLPG